MIEGMLSEARAAMRGRLLGEDRAFRGLSSDTRTLGAGELYFALRGPNFDGAAFVSDAAAKEAAGAVVQEPVAAPLPSIVVDDTRRALGELAADWRRRQPVRVVALTGSNGKTTLKEIIASCLAPVAPTLATRGNLNNDVGLPLMLAELDETHRYAVMEMGANHFGEIAWLTSLAQPQVVIITNAGPAHLEGFGDLEGVARAKGEILSGTERPEHAVLNADDRFFPYWKELAADLPVTSFGWGEAADFRAVDVEAGVASSRFRLLAREQELAIDLPLAGKHNVVHACAAAAAAFALGIDAAAVSRGLASVRPVSGRLQPLSARGGATVYDDSYNANPASVVAAGEFVARQQGPCWLALGDMRELGGEAEELHRRVGRALREAGVDRLYAAGTLSRHAVEAFGTDGRWFETVDELASVLAGDLEAGVNVLVKGSRAMRMERVVAALRDEPVRN